MSAWPRLGSRSIWGVVVFGTLGAAAAEEPVTWVCPGRVDGVASAAVEAAPAGWVLQANVDPQRLTAVMVYDGPPERDAPLKPKWAAADGRRMVWSLRGLAAPSAWVSCEYSGGSLRLVRAVPAGMRWCEATVTRQPPPADLEISVQCAVTERPGL
jgi:hypothetical protein